MIPRRDIVTIVRATPGGTDEYGDPVEGATSEWQVVTLFPVAPRTTSDSDAPDHEGGVALGKRLALPLGTDIQPGDRVRIAGELWNIDGEIAEWRPAWGFGPRRGAIEVMLTRSEVGTWQAT